MSILFISAKSDKSVQNLLEVCSRLLLSPFYKLECAILSFIVTIYHDILDKHIARQENVCSTESSSGGWIQITAESYGWLELRQLDTSWGCLKLWRMDTSYDWLHPTADSNSCGWIRVVADSFLRPTRVPAAGYELQLTPPHVWREFKRLNTSYSWLHPTTDSSSGRSIRLTVDSSCSWLACDSNWSALIFI